MQRHLLVTASVTAQGLDVRNAKVRIHEELVEVGQAGKFVNKLSPTPKKDTRTRYLQSQ